MNRTMTVTQLSSYLKGVFDDEELLHDVTLTGEVTDVSYSDKHTFLVLADGACSVRCVHFYSRDAVEKGARVALKGSVGFYDKRCAVSFNYTEFYRQGIGDKNAKLAEIKQRLYEKGYFENRPQLPKYITDVVAVTSPDGAAIRDFIRVVHDKAPFVRIRVYPVKVQGDGAAAQMCAAVKNLQNIKTDAIVLCRGGGSDEDLDCFNDEELASTVALSTVPVISAVGHEINYSMCDYCAGVRAGTPSIAGEVVAARAYAIVADLYQATCAIKAQVARRYASNIYGIERCCTSITNAVSRKAGGGYNSVRMEMRRAYYAVNKKLSAKANRLATAANMLRIAQISKYSASKARTEKLKALLTALDPHRIIKVGYAAVLRGGMRIINSAELKKDDKLKLVFSDGTATAVVTDITPNNN